MCVCVLCMHMCTPQSVLGKSRKRTFDEALYFK